MKGVVLAAILALLALAGACGPATQEEPLELWVPVSVEEVGRATVEERIETTGTLRAREVVNLVVETPGIFRCARHPSGRRLAEGDLVRAGQLVAEITGEDVRLAARTEATFERFQAAERDYQAKKALFDDGLISELELQQAEAALIDARLEWESSQLTERRTRLASPVDGVLLRLARQDDGGPPLADGQKVQAGYVAAQVAPLDPLVVDVDLLGSDLGRVRAGMQARIRHHAFPDREFRGILRRLSPAVDPSTRTVRGEVETRSPQGLLRPGMFVEVELLVERHEDVPVVPREAVTEREGRKVVFVVRGQRAVQRPVRLGIGDTKQVEITDGVEPGERVVVRGLETLTDGVRVRIAGG